MASKTFVLKSDLKSQPMNEHRFVDFVEYLYRSSPVKQNNGKILMVTNPEENGGRCVNAGFSNGFVGALYRAYNEHRHLILRPDDVWLAITTAFGIFMNGGDNAEHMRKHFVDFEGKIELVASSAGTLYTVDWNMMIDLMSEQIDKNTKKDAKDWIEPDFSTTNQITKTVGKVVLMGIFKKYFDYKMCLSCGLPKVTLEGTLEDWQKLRQKAARLGTFEVDCLTHWSKLLDYVLEKLEESYKGNADVDFWSKMAAHEGWGSGPRYIAGWVNVFMPFSEQGTYRLQDVEPAKGEWGKTDHNDVPPSAVEVPVKIDDNGHEYDTIFYAGHLVCNYNPADNSLRPSLDWAMVDITGSTGPSNDCFHKEYNFSQYPKPAVFKHGA